MTESLRNWLGASLLALATTACGSANEPESVAPSTGGETLTQAIAAHAELGTTSDALSQAQLNEVFDGAGSYTVLAPSDDAFTALGTRGERLLSLEQRPVLVGMLREHVLPGHVTPAAIAAAIDSHGGSAVMTTVGGGSVTFTREGETIRATHSSGTTARFAGEAVESGNGVAIPIDAVLSASGADAPNLAQ